jgi:hypothetical protein
MTWHKCGCGHPSSEHQVGAEECEVIDCVCPEFMSLELYVELLGFKIGRLESKLDSVTKNLGGL